MTKTLIQNSRIRQELLDKMSFFVMEYATHKKVLKYILTQNKFRDSYGIIYYVKLIDKPKLFMHTAYFKKYKNIHNMVDSSGKKKGISFTTQMDEWFVENHKIYLEIELKIYNFFQPDFLESDLILINKLYQEFKNEQNNKARKGIL